MQNHRPFEAHGRRAGKNWALLGSLMLFAAFASVCVDSRAQSDSVPVPTSVVPLRITPQSHPWFSATYAGETGVLPDGSVPTRADLARYRYVEEEFVIEGTARQYDVTTGAQIGTQPYRTRVVVRRPADARNADGTVVFEWINVTANWDMEIDWLVSRDHFMRSGYVWVGASVQRAGVQALRNWSLDPARYAGLTVGEDAATADAQSYDIFSQVAQALRRPRSAGLLPPRFEVKRIIATGHSQSARFLAGYFNVIQPQHRLIDAYLIHGLVNTNVLRTDTNVPVIKVQAEYDVNSKALSDEADGPFYRRWEVAGASHVQTKDRQTYYALLRRDRPDYVPGACTLPPYSHIPFDHVQNAAYAHLVRWLDKGIAPPSAPRYQWLDATTKARDANGNVLGGIRLPQHVVATATNSGANTGPGFCPLAGSHVPFDTAKLMALYPTVDSYLMAMEQATQQSVDAGFLLPADAQETRDKAACFAVNTLRQAIRGMGSNPLPTNPCP